MRFIHEIGFDILEGKTREAQEWLTEHEGELAKTCPAGIEYLGTFVAVHTSVPRAGAFRQLWRYDSYAAQDRFAEAMRDGGRFAELVDEFSRLVDQRNDAHWYDGLYKSLVDASIWGE